MCFVTNCNCLRSVFVSKSNGQSLIRIICKDLLICGSCKLIWNCLFYWYGYFIYSYLLLCIFFVQYLSWNPNKSLDLFSIYTDFPLYTVKSVDFCGKICNISVLNPSKLVTFVGLVSISSPPASSQIQVVRGVSFLKICQFRSILNSKLVNYSILCNICYEILHVFRISFNILSDFTPNIVKSMDLNKSSIFFIMLIVIVKLSPWILCTSRLILTSGVKRREVSVFCF